MWKKQLMKKYHMGESRIVSVSMPAISPNLESSSSSSNDCICDKCGKMFCKPVNLVNHQITHSDFCAVCGKESLKTFKKNTTNSNVHSDGSPHKCSICYSTFETVSALALHSKSHQSETPYKCNTCGKTYKHKQSLNSHAKSHLDNELHTCEECGRKFKSKKLLRMHMKCYSDGRPHKFTKSEQWKASFTAPQKYLCGFPECYKAYKREEGLRKHMDSHTKKSTFKSSKL